MKTKIIGILVCMLMIIPVFSMTVAADEGANLEIRAKRIGIGKFCCYIANTGDSNAENVEWDIFLNDPDVNKWFWNGTIPNIAPGEEEMICTGELSFGIRFIDVQVTATVNGLDPVEEIFWAFYFLFILIRLS